MPMRLAILVFVFAAVPVAAQPVSPVAPCSYETCAIRVEHRLFGSPQLVRGAPGAEQVIGSTGVLGGGLRIAVADVPVAAEHAAASQRARVGARVAAGVATGAYVVALSESSWWYGLDGFADDTGDLYWAALTTAAVSVIVGGVFEVRARREEARAVWEYNRATAAE